MARVLMVWPNKEQSGSKPNSISLLSALLRRAGHDVRLLDTTFVDLGFIDNTAVGSKARIFKPVDSGGIDLGKKPADLDKMVGDVLKDFRPQIVAVSAMSDEIPVGLRISRTVKKIDPAVTVVWGNKGPTLSAQRVLADKAVDYICVGEGIEFLPNFVGRMERGDSVMDLPNLGFRTDGGKVGANPLSPYFTGLDSLPVFDYSVYDDRQFLKPFDGRLLRGGDHMITWGCPNRCTYCINDTMRKLYGDKARPILRSYSAGRIIGELWQLAEKWRLEFFKFHDEDFCLKPLNFFRELSDRYRREINIPFTCMANARSVTSAKVELLAAMNCRSISLGFETGSEKIRREVLKRAESSEQIVKATELLNGAGIRTTSFNMLGLPFESRQTFFETVELNRRSGVLWPNVNFFFPYEGSELRRLAVENGFFDDSSDAVYMSDRPTLKLPGISEQELVTLRERFVLYVKLPRSFWPHIERSEKPDQVGKNLTEKLYQIYERTVQANAGRWPDSIDAGPLLQELEKIGR
ncbi:MAG: B12-binding domain-containing radical SAM protein [Planctomycetes bacterium]|nr:B12-binding domain-containing radical SAM protein [Planctomycetota bacterium]